MVINKNNNLILLNILYLNILVVVLYVITGYFGLLLSVPPGYATAIWPASGIALGAVLIWGLRVLPGVLIGSFLINLFITLQSNQPLWEFESQLIAIVIGIGALLQSCFGYFLIKHSLGLKNKLLSPKDILKFALLSGPISCLVNATWSNLFLFIIGIVGGSDFILSWGTWWIGDMIGVLIFTPLFLIAFSKERRDWQARTFAVAIPLIISFAIVVVLYTLIKSMEETRINNEYAVRVQNDLAKVVERLDIEAAITNSLKNYIEVVPNLDNAEFSAFTKRILQKHKYIQALEWIPLVHNKNEFERRASKELGREFVITEIQNQKSVPVTQREMYFPVYFVEPFEPNKGALGFDIASNSERLAALQRSKYENRLILSRPIKLVQTHLKDTGVLLFSPVYIKNSFSGYALTVLNVNKMVGTLFSDKKYIHSIDIVDDNKKVYSYIDGDTSFNGKRFIVKYSKAVSLFGRDWRFESIASTSFVNMSYSWQIWVVLIGGALFCILMNIILFIISGQKRIVEQEVEIKTNALTLEEVKNSLILNSAGEGIIGVNCNDEITFVNKMALKMLGYSEEQLLFKSMHQTLHHSYSDRKPYQIEKCPIVASYQGRKIRRQSNEVFWRKDGSNFWVEYTSTPLIHDDETIGAVVVFNDVSDRHITEKKLEKLAHFDPLTSLPNRANLFAYVRKVIKSAKTNKSNLAVCFIDIDNFKQINDSLGHKYGDNLLTMMSKILKSPASNHYLGRLGGDEFALIIEGYESRADLSHVLNHYLNVVREPIAIEGTEINVSISIGVAEFPHAGSTVDDLLKHADIAMYHAKEQGKNRAEFFNKALRQKISHRHMIEAQLYNAIKNNEFTLVYQPQYNHDASHIVGVEALVRWDSPIIGAVSPGEFIPIAEENGLIHKIGKIIFHVACRDGAVFQSISPELILSINVSVKELELKTYLHTVNEVLEEHHINPKNLMLEVIESAIMKEPGRAMVVMKKLQALGITFALDDFGKGQSSMVYLKNLPISMIKIDQEFVQDILSDESDAAIVQATINLAHTLGLSAIAEGVETKEQFAALQKLKCDNLQGFYFSKPMSAEQIIQLLKKQADHK